MAKLSWADTPVKDDLEAHIQELRSFRDPLQQAVKNLAMMCIASAVISTAKNKADCIVNNLRYVRNTLRVDMKLLPKILTEKADKDKEVESTIKDTTPDESKTPPSTTPVLKLKKRGRK